jgi:4-amino-4-deoxy-L-arabinose transferase-like glycosyltransferase
VKPFLVTPLQAARMPRWLLLLLCALYVVPGLLGRDPWRAQDAAGFGVAWTMARGLGQPGGLADWLMPNVLGVTVGDEGPLPFWLGAAAMRALPLLPPDTMMRVTAMGWLALMLTCLWYGTWLLARRPEVQPADPFGASAQRTDFGRSVADSALLVTLATFGLLARAHETTAESAQLAWITLWLYGCALALLRPRIGGALAGLAIGLTLTTRGLPTAVALSAACVALLLFVRPYRLVRGPMLSGLLPVALATALPWPAALWLSGDAGSVHLALWLGWMRYEVSGPEPQALGYLLRTMPWFFWPAWPLAAWAVWRWRERALEPAIAVPGCAALALLLLAALSPNDSESPLVPLVPPLAMLAAFGLPTIRRGVTSLIDWFAVMTFTLTGLALWAYWFALHTGWPPRMAYRAQQAVIGFVPEVNAVEVLLGALVTVSWGVLVALRVSRQPPAMWRSVVLSSGGMVLAWCLLMTLWLPAGNYRKTYRDVAQQAGAVVTDDHRCVRTGGLDVAQRASFAYFGGLRIDDAAPGCDWLLVTERDGIAYQPTRGQAEWRLAWRGQRPADRDERFALFRRVGG